MRLSGFCQNAIAIGGALLLIAESLCFTAPAFSRDFKPAIAFDAGGRQDESFNQAAARGVDRFKAETGIDPLSAEATGAATREGVLRTLAGQGASIVVAVGFAYSDAVETVAKEFPDVEFTIIDAVAAGANIQAVTMREQEGSFLVGMVAAMKSKTGKLGFIGGIDAPLIRKFAAGYKLGALRINPHTEIVEDTIGSDEHAWHDPDRAAALARRQFAEGADIVYAAAGASGLGVYKVAKEAGKLAIGVDSNQNGLYPGTMLTSMVKRVDVIVYKAFKSAQEGDWTAGAENLGLANDAVGWALDENNRSLITPAMEQRVNRVAQDIIAGRIQVSDYSAR